MTEPHQSSAAQAVFALPELLEQVVLQLPARDVVTIAMRVNRTWKQVTETSPKIQRKLFRPCKLTPQTIRPSRFNPWGRPSTLDIPFYDVFLTFNPLLEGYMTLNSDSSLCGRMTNASYHTYNPDRTRSNWYHAIRFAIKKLSSAHPLDHIGLGASAWANTFITDPPCSTAYVFQNMDSARYSIHKAGVEMSMRTVRGITCATLADTLFSASEMCLGEDSAVEFCVLLEYLPLSA